MDALSRILGTPTAGEEREARQAEQDEERVRQGKILERRQRVAAEDKLFELQSSISIAYGLVPTPQDGLLEGGAVDESFDIATSRQLWLRTSKPEEGAEDAAYQAPKPPPVPELSASGDTFLVPFIRSPYVQQLDMVNKMNLFEPRWLW